MAVGLSQLLIKRVLTDW